MNPCPSCGQPRPDGVCRCRVEAVEAESVGPTFNWYEDHVEMPVVSFMATGGPYVSLESGNDDMTEAA